MAVLPFFRKESLFASLIPACLMVEEVKKIPPGNRRIVNADTKICKKSVIAKNLI